MVLVERYTRQLYGANGLAMERVWRVYIPEDLMTSTIVSVPKKGDLRDMNNSRGLYEFDACVCEDCVCSDSSSYQL